MITTLLYILKIMGLIILILMAAGAIIFLITLPELRPEDDVKAIRQEAEKEYLEYARE